MTEDQRLIVEGVANPDGCCLEMETIEAVKSALDEIDRLRWIVEELLNEVVLHNREYHHVTSQTMIDKAQSVIGGR